MVSFVMPRCCSSREADERREAERLGLRRERRVVAGQLARRLEIVARGEPGAVGRHDGPQLGVAPSDLAGGRLVAVDVGVGEPPLEVVVLRDQQLHRLEQGNS